MVAYMAHVDHDKTSQNMRIMCSLILVYIKKWKKYVFATASLC